MKSFYLYILLGLFVSLPAMAGSSGRARVYAKVDADTAIYPGDSFVYSIVVEGGAKPDKIDLSAIARFNPRRTGSGTSMQTIGDRTTISYSENYAIAAGQVGTMQLPGVTVVVGGRTYTTNPVEVTVSKPGTTDRMTLEFTVSDTKCYVGQPIVMTVRWTVTARVQGAAFAVPVFQSDDFYIEDVTQAAGAWAREQAAIHGVPVTVTEDRRLIRGVEAAVISFTKVLIPKRAGRITLDPVSVAVNMAVGRVRTNDFFNPYQMKYERVSVQSNPVELDVLALPAEGKPDQFYGLVGSYTISASATPTDVSVGDPITLTIRIGGNPYLKPVQWPALERIPDLAAGFKIPAEQASPVIESGDKVFTQTIRANSDTVIEVPPIPLAYFDTRKGEYAVAKTYPIPLAVAPTKVLTNADVEGTSFTPANRGVEAIRKGLSANYYGPEVLVNQRFTLASAITHPVYAAIWSLPLIVLAASSAVKLARRTSPESLARKRRGQAAGVAVGQLKKIDSVDPAQRHELLSDAMKGYIGDRFDRVAASLTADECHHAILESTGEAEIAGAYRDLVAACETAHYASVDAEIDSDETRRAVELIHDVEKRLRK